MSVVRSYIPMTTLLGFTIIFLCILPAAVVRSFSYASAICHVLPVLRITLRFPIIGPTARIMCIPDRREDSVTFSLADFDKTMSSLMRRSVD